MKYLMNQSEFEVLLGRGDVVEETPKFSVVYFTATWCGACRSLNVPMIESNTPGVNWLKCDIDQNNYTPGYCGIRSIPSFLAIKDKKVVGMIQSNDSNEIVNWTNSLV